MLLGREAYGGKGFLNGTQTKLKYVPEQDTDFIFCTVGEEEGFIGSAAVLFLFTGLILRLYCGGGASAYSFCPCLWIFGIKHFLIPSVY